MRVLLLFVFNLLLLTQVYSQSTASADQFSEDSVQAFLKVAWKQAETLPQETLEQARDVLMFTHDQEARAELNALMGSIYKRSADYEKSLSSYFQALQNTTDREKTAAMYNEISHVYRILMQYELAEEYAQKSVEISGNSGDQSPLGRAYAVLGSAHLGKGDTTQALQCFRKSLEIYESANLFSGISSTATNIANLYRHTGRYREALPFYERALQLATRQNDRHWMALSLSNMGTLYSDQENHKEALRLQLEALEIASKMHNNLALTDIYYHLSATYARAGKHILAHRYLNLHVELLKKSFNLQTSHQLAELQARYETEGKDRENKLLKEENKLKKALIAKQNLKEWGLIILVMLLCVIAVLLWISFGQKSRSHRILKQQNDIINHQRHEIINKNRVLEAQNEQLITLNEEINYNNSELKHINEQLSELNEEKNHILGIVSHDLKAPLKRVAGLVQLISFEPERLSEDQKDCLDRINIVMKQNLQMIQQLLDVTAIEEQKRKVTLQKMEVQKLVNPLIGHYKRLAAEKSITLHYKQPDEELVLNTNDQYLNRILDNLLSNAVKFSPFDTHIYVRLYREANKVKIDVEDQGPGLNEDDQKHIFKKFQRLSAKPTGLESSTGLGLSIVKTLVERLGGHISFRSEYGKGTTFTIEFEAQMVNANVNKELGVRN